MNQQDLEQKRREREERMKSVQGGSVRGRDSQVATTKLSSTKTALIEELKSVLKREQSNRKQVDNEQVNKIKTKSEKGANEKANKVVTKGSKVVTETKIDEINSTINTTDELRHDQQKVVKQNLIIREDLALWLKDYAYTKNRGHRNYFTLQHAIEDAIMALQNSTDEDGMLIHSIPAQNKIKYTKKTNK